MQASYNQPPPPRAHSPPQYASFEQPKKGGDDLPQMPSWEGAGSKKVMLEEEQDAVEMDQLKKPAHNDPRNPHAGPAAAGVVSPISAADGRGPYNPPNRGPGRGYMAGAAAAGPGGAGYGRRPVSPLHDQGYGPNSAYNQGRSGPGGPGGPGGYGNNGYDNAFNQGRGQNLNAPNDYNSNRISDGYGLDQPYDSPNIGSGSHTGGPGTAGLVGAGLAGGAAGAALAAGAMRHQSPGPGPHRYGTPQQQPASPYTELSGEGGNPFHQGPDGGFVEMPDEPRRKDPEVNVHAAFAEMSADGAAKSPVQAEAPKEPEPIAFELATDQVAPIELDGGYVPPLQSKQADNSIPQSHSAELDSGRPHVQTNDSRSPTSSSYHEGPEVYDPQQHAAPGGAPRQPGQYNQSRQGSVDSRSAPDGYGMRRQRTGDSGAGSPVGPGPQAPYGMDPRMRNSPGPMSPRSPGPRGSPAPGPGSRRPGPPGGQPFSPSPLSTPAPNESPYGRPSYGQGPGPNRTYSPAPRQPRSPDHNVPVGRPNGQTAFAEPQPQSPITNTGGFDFTSGFSRPQTGNSERRQPQNDSYDQRRPQQPGYQGQRPPNNQGGWNGGY